MQLECCRCQMQLLKQRRCWLMSSGWKACHQWLPSHQESPNTAVTPGFISVSAVLTHLGSACISWLISKNRPGPNKHISNNMPRLTSISATTTGQVYIAPPLCLAVNELMMQLSMCCTACLFGSASTARYCCASEVQTGSHHKGSFL